MIERTITDDTNLQWNCVQAYSGLEDKNAELAEEISETTDGKVIVVCTPSGGAQTVRLHLDKNWIDMPEEELKSAIQDQHK